MAVAPPAPVLLMGQQALLGTLGKGSPGRCRAGALCDPAPGGHGPSACSPPSRCVPGSMSVGAAVASTLAGGAFPAAGFSSVPGKS